MEAKQNIFQQKGFVVLFALMATFAWGCAYPLIKLGFVEFAINAADTGGKLLFAGLRFSLAGWLILLIAKLSHKSFVIKKAVDWYWLLLFAFVNTSFHYFCLYIGISHCAGTRTAIIDSLGTFLLVLLASFIFKEALTTRKVLGCVLGFAGVLVINFQGASLGGFTLLGDGMIALNAMCAAFGGVLTRIVGRRMDMLVATGLSLGLGGLLLVVGGAALGGGINAVTPLGLILLAGLVAVSTVGFSLYNMLLSCNPVGEIAIFNALIPVFGIMLSCLFLGEAFLGKYLLAGLLIASGVYVVNK